MLHEETNDTVWDLISMWNNKGKEEKKNKKATVMAHDVGRVHLNVHLGHSFLVQETLFLQTYISKVPSVVSGAV